MLFAQAGQPELVAQRGREFDALARRVPQQVAVGGVVDVALEHVAVRADF